MPIYEYECTACGGRFDRLQRLADPDPTHCPSCAQPNVRRCVTAPSFRLAGSGWYETDFKKDGDKKRNLAGNDDAPKAADKPADKTPDKPAEKSSEKTTEKKAEKKADAAPPPAPKSPPPTTAN